MLSKMRSIIIRYIDAEIQNQWLTSKNHKRRIEEVLCNTTQPTKIAANLESHVTAITRHSKS